MKHRFFYMLVSMAIGASAVLSSGSFFSSGSDTKSNYTITDYSVAQNFYQDVIQGDEWRSVENRMERGEKLQLSESMLEHMSTDALIEAVLDYPFFSDIYFFDNIQDGFKSMFSSFNGVQELAKRDDAGTVLLGRYCAEAVPENVLPDFAEYHLIGLEILLSQDFIIDKLTSDEKELLVKEAATKYRLKSDSAAYSDSFCNILLDLLTENSDDAFITGKIRGVKAQP